MLAEFKSFIMRGNVLDLAIAVIIGAAFGAIISSFVNDILTPLLGLFTGGVDLSNMFFALDGGNYPTLVAAQEAGAATVNYGVFLNAILNFLIVGWALFMIVKAANNSKKEEAAAPPPGPTTEEKLLGEIRDLLAKK